jgi:hypothetical protein
MASVDVRILRLAIMARQKSEGRERFLTWLHRRIRTRPEEPDLGAGNPFSIALIGQASAASASMWRRFKNAKRKNAERQSAERRHADCKNQKRTGTGRINGSKSLDVFGSLVAFWSKVADRIAWVGAVGQLRQNVE